MEAAKRIGYRPNLAARMLRTQKSNTIAFIIPTDEENRSANFFYMDVLLGIQQKLWEIGFNVIVSNYNTSISGERSLNALEVCRKQWVDGVIFVPSSKNNTQLDVLKEMGVPFVLVDRQVDGKDNYSFIVSDHEQGVYDAVKLLAENGYKKIGFIGGALRISSGYERYRGYVKAIRTCGFECNEDFVSLTEHFSIEEGKKAIRKLLESGVDSVLVADNILCVGVILELRKQKKVIPNEIGVIGYDDCDWMEFNQPSITAIKQQTHKMGYLAAEIMEKKLNGEEKDEHVRLKTELVLRQSHGDK